MALPAFLDPAPWLPLCGAAAPTDVRRALDARTPGVREFAALLSPAAAESLEEMALRARHLTRQHFGRTISLYVPLYLSNYCSGGCVYCGFAADRNQPRRKLNRAELQSEVEALHRVGFEDVLLLTGERCPEADFGYLLDCVNVAVKRFHSVAVESFAMTAEEYRQLAEAGCTGVTLYQETYDPSGYARLHRWGPKRDYLYRLQAPERGLGAGLRTFGVGALLGLNDPRFEALCLFRHVEYLRKRFWRSGLTVSFPRLCHEQGDYHAAHAVSDRFLAQMIFAFRICLPDLPLVLSTREVPAFRDGMAGVGISRMSAASRTTVGGYGSAAAPTGGQFSVNDPRDVAAFCSALRAKGLEPVFKNWDGVF
jgi:2-iminoacetate synthase